MLSTTELTRDYLIALGVMVTAFGLLLFIKRVFWQKFGVWFTHRYPDLDAGALKRFRAPLNFLSLVFACFLALPLAPEGFATSPFVLTASKALFVVGGYWLLRRGLLFFFHATSRKSHMTVSTRTLLQTLSQIALLAVIGPILLSTLGISLTPVLASLGVGSIAVALAAQDTLSNFFSGIYMLIDQPIRVGDVIRFDGSFEGTVRRIGWRSTHILGGSNNLIVIPNSKLSSSVVTNFSLPSEETVLTVPLTVARGDLEKIERITLEVARSVMPRGMSAAPSVRFVSIGEAVQFQAVLRAPSLSETAGLRHEFLKALAVRFATDGIAFPSIGSLFPLTPAAPA